MASPRPARLISRRAGRTTPVATRGWMGGVSRRAASSLAPEISICLPSETPNKGPSLTRLQVRAGLHKGRGLSRRTQLLFAAFKRIRRDPRIAGRSDGLECSPDHVNAEVFERLLRGLDVVAERWWMG